MAPKVCELWESGLHTFSGACSYDAVSHQG